MRPCEEKMFQIMVDAYSKWLDNHPMNTVISIAIILKLNHTFVKHGLPDQCVRDDATSFTNSDFEELMTNK